MRRLLLLSTALTVSCATTSEPAKLEPAPAKTPPAGLLPEEVHLSELRQLTFGGENAEAYWSFDGKKLSLQATRAGEQCDRIRVLDVATSVDVQISSGKGATTCAHFLP